MLLTFNLTSLVALFVTVVLKKMYCPLDSEKPGIVAVLVAVAAAVVQYAKPDNVVLVLLSFAQYTLLPVVFNTWPLEPPLRVELLDEL